MRNMKECAFTFRFATDYIGWVGGIASSIGVSRHMGRPLPTTFQFPFVSSQLLEFYCI
jgi:hypothetical protein